jgi:hypothetical protein
VCAHLFFLPVAAVTIKDDGSGHVSYTRRFDFAEVEEWLIATLAGGVIERMIWGSAADGSDRRAIDEMVRRTLVRDFLVFDNLPLIKTAEPRFIDS